MIYLAGVIAFLISLLVTPLVIKLAKRWGIIDNPKRAHPAILHKIPLPRAGGLPPLIAIIVSYLLFAPIDKHIIGIFLASILIVAVGILDDKYDLNPYLRLGTNIAAVLLVVGFGVGIHWIKNPLGGEIRFDELVLKFEFFGPHSIVVWADLFALVWIIWLMNALNWSSGVDGQLPGIVAVATFILGLVSLRYLETDPAQLTVVILAFVTAGAYLGFLPWSFYPQKIMPGYGGSTLAGFMLAVLSILAGAKLATALLVLAVPLIDSFWTIIRRISKGHSPVWGDKEHLHHKLLELGWSKRAVALFYWIICAILGTAALNLNSDGKFFAGILVLVVVFSVLLAIAAGLKKTHV